MNFTLLRPLFGLLLCPSLVLAEQVGPWNLTALHEVNPKVEWISKDGAVQSLLYEGERFKGKETQVFAFYASPRTLDPTSKAQKFPGVVLIHGGGGTAFAEWTWLWAKRGYAAIAMDLAGARPPAPEYGADGRPLSNAHKPEGRTRLPNGGPDHGRVEKFDCIGGDGSDDWPFHAAASVIRAHNVLRAFPEVDAERTAVTGISWGGYTTCLVASLDPRFKAAVPVYGCGFLYEGESVQKPSIDSLGDRREAWVREYDPSSLLPRCSVPILFVNGTNDVHYPLDSYLKTYDVVKSEKAMRIEVNMRHGHPPGWAPKEIGLFIDSKCMGGKPLPVIANPVVQDGRVTAGVDGEVLSAALHYTTDSGLRSQRKWQTLPLAVKGQEISGEAPPGEANTWFVTATDAREAMVSSIVIIKGM